MTNGLSQAEIEALLNGENAVAAATPVAQDTEAEAAPTAAPEGEAPAAQETSVPNQQEALTSQEIDTCGEMGNISMGTSATTLSTMLRHRVDITTPRVSVASMEDIAQKYPLPFVGVEVQYTKGLKGTNLLFLHENDVKIITDLLMGGDGKSTEGELTDLHLSAISEVMNQMVGSSSTSLAKLVGEAIDISPPTAFQINLSQSLEDSPIKNLKSPMVCISFDMVVGDLINSEIMQIMPLDFAKEMVDKLVHLSTAAVAASAVTQTVAPAPVEAPKPVPAPAPAAPATPPPPPAAAPQQPPQQASAAPSDMPPPYAVPPGYPPTGAYGYPPPGYGYPPYPPAARPVKGGQPDMVDIRPVNLEAFDAPSGAYSEQQVENMDLLMNVPLSVSVELGKSRKFIREVLDFNIGSIIVLDKMAGELVDVVVNGKLIARGEVVVIDDNYGVRISDIIGSSRNLLQEP